MYLSICIYAFKICGLDIVFYFNYLLIYYNDIVHLMMDIMAMTLTILSEITRHMDIKHQ